MSSKVYDYGMMFPESLKVEEDEPRAPPGGTRSMGAGLISTDAKIAEEGPDGLPEIEQVDLYGKGDGIARGIWKLSNRQGDREELTPHHTKGRADGKLLLTARTSDAEARKSPESSQVTSIRVKLKTSVGGAMAKTLALREAPKKGGCNAPASKGNKEKENGGGAAPRGPQNVESVWSGVTTGVGRDLGGDGRPVLRSTIESRRI